MVTNHLQDHGAGAESAAAAAAVPDTHTHTAQEREDAGDLIKTCSQTGLSWVGGASRTEMSQSD